MADNVANPQSLDPITAHNLRVMMIDCVFWSAMFGLGESYFQPFGVALQFSPLAIGLLATLPPLLGAAIQLLAPTGVRAVGSLRRWVVICVAMQALSFLPLVIGAMRGHLSAMLLFAALTLYFAAALSSAPAWTTWVGTLVPARMRVRYFARRSRLIQIAMFLSFLAAGYALEFGKRGGHEMLVFVALFGAAGLARGISACLIASQSEAQMRDQVERSISWPGFLAELRRLPAIRFLLFAVITQFVVQVAHPFITPYFLQSRQLSYDHYVIAMSAIFVAKIVALAPLGSLANRLGAGRIMVGGVAVMMPIPLLLLHDGGVIYFFAVQLAHGAGWAAFELGNLLLMFERIPETVRTTMLTKYNLLVYLAMLLGSSIGGAILRFASESETDFSLAFAASTAMRLAALVLAAKLVRVAANTR
ncbi:MAG: hypothetical protein JNG88_05310 [Phycisphaerales bacterium]|nr:hypothetical protein [Phycisphaerales bacterium]